MKIKTSELIGAALDWAVAEALEIDYFRPDTGPSQPEFSTDWAQGLFEFNFPQAVIQLVDHVAIDSATG